MAWLVLVISGVFEAVWAVALSRSDGLTRLWPTVTFGAALAVSMAGLGWAMRTLPVGTSYSVWVGIGASLAVTYSMLTGAEAATPARIVLIAGLIVCIVGLKALPASP